jgi:transposase
MPAKRKLTPAVLKLIVDAIGAGNYIETAAAYAGISKNTLYEWLKRGRRAKKADIYTEFVEAVEKAMADAEVRDVAQIAQASSIYWQASAWRLERKYPDRWGRKTAIELDSNKSTTESLTGLILASMVGDSAYQDEAPKAAKTPKPGPDETEPTPDPEAAA